jgi:chromate reductase
MTIKIVVISGSLRKNSKNTALANVAVDLNNWFSHQQDQFDQNVTIFKYDISSIPLFNEDIEQDINNYPNILEMYDTVRDCDGILFVTPENNFLPSAPMKNIIDWLSRGDKKAPLNNKIVGLISAGASGGFLAQEALRKSFEKMLKFIDMTIIEETVNVKLFDGVKRFDDANNLIDSDTIDGIKNVLAVMIEKIKNKRLKLDC